MVCHGGFDVREETLPGEGEGRGPGRPKPAQRRLRPAERREEPPRRPELRREEPPLERRAEPLDLREEPKLLPGEPPREELRPLERREEAPELREAPNFFPAERATEPRLLRAEPPRAEPPPPERRDGLPEARKELPGVRGTGPPALEREEVLPPPDRWRSERARRAIFPLAAALSCREAGPKARRDRFVREAPPRRGGWVVRRGAGALRVPVIGARARVEKRR